MDKQSELYPPDQAGEYLGGTPPATLQWWRHKGRGPRYIKLGRRVLYRREDLDAFIAASERVPEHA